MLIKRSMTRIFRDSNQFWTQKFLWNDNCLPTVIFVGVQVGEDDACWSSFNPSARTNWSEICSKVISTSQTTGQNVENKWQCELYFWTEHVHHEHLIDWVCPVLCSGSCNYFEGSGQQMVPPDFVLLLQTHFGSSASFLVQLFPRGHCLPSHWSNSWTVALFDVLFARVSVMWGLPNNWHLHGHLIVQRRCIDGLRVHSFFLPFFTVIWSDCPPCRGSWSLSVNLITWGTPSRMF